jgi:hypothetical protein
VTALKDLLQQYDANILKIIAREHNIESKNQPKQVLADVLARKLRERDEVERAITRVGLAEREVLALAQRGRGEVATSVLETTLKKSALLAPTRQKKSVWDFRKPAGDPNYTGKPTLEDAAARLALLGLAFAREPREPLKQTVNFELGRYLVIPQDIRAFLPAFGQIQNAPANEPARVVPGSARNFQRDFSRYWSFVRRDGKLDLTTQGWAYKKSLVELVKALGWSDKKKPDEQTDRYLYFLRRMLSALNLADSNLYAPNFALAAIEKDYWAQTPTKRVKQAFEAYLDTAAWNELRIPKTTYGSDHRNPAPRELPRARRVIVEHLKTRGAAGWVALADLLQDIRLGDYEFLFPRQRQSPTYSGYDYGSPYHSSNNPYNIAYSDVRDETSGWDVVEGAIITHTVTGPLHWLGLIDVGFDGDAPIAYRLTGMGAWLLGLGAEIKIANEGGRVVVQPNFQIVAMEPIAEQVLMALDEFTQFEGGDRALTYRLTRESVYRAQRANWDAARIVTFLEDATRMPLPQNVKRSLEEWQTLHERITIRRGVALVQTEDGATLDELFAIEPLAPQLGRRASADVVLARAGASAVQGALREAGWLAVFTRRDQTDAPASVTTDETGNVTLVHRTPSIYAYEGIEAFAERVDARRARITPESVHAACQQKLDVPAMLARLRAVHRGEIPAQLVTRLKAWGKYFGGATLGALILIEFRDEQARAELLNDPALQPHLERFDAGNRPLARVRAESLEHVKELLAERGVDLKEW